MKKDGKCTPGVYVIKGEKGIRVGQSICPETRVPRVARQLESCIGKANTVHVIPIMNRINDLPELCLPQLKLVLCIASNRRKV